MSLFDSQRISKVSTLFILTITVVRSQKIGTYTTETHPALTWSTCTEGGSCTTTIDVSCAQDCALDGANYEGTYGITSSGNELHGAQYGVGYCDSRCPRDLKFIQGLTNVEDWTPSSNNANTGVGNYGSCCAELDIWEANSVLEALTPHPCDTPTNTRCEGDARGGTYTNTRYAGTCNPDGCDFNPSRLGNTSFYESRMTITRYYVQNDVVIPQPASQISGITGNVINVAFCSAELSVFAKTTAFTSHGGMSSVGKALSSGMVLVISVWDDYSASMLWLDSMYATNDTATTPGAKRGTCATTSGVPKTVNADDPNAYVIFSDIRVGPIKSTFTGGS
ncbi:concanavalin A-like lectin/glucanase domain-containing protein [Talaromyces proteolyticus]|uniref:Glucanase n=1 Tax=Talaromyces proteolyticus TaxID=1131652 RepID=A0AAD4KG88_9EURO|nr:concanavalin A-like lectin/glucanase domain-containing protein [Talaromyces proteolyticus]KAH8690321.1 concanavalin A-like lectin/glucanase domain-containing protein [Talaromyces proteolyticus]